MPDSAARTIACNTFAHTQTMTRDGRSADLLYRHRLLVKAFQFPQHQLFQLVPICWLHWQTLQLWQTVVHSRSEQQSIPCLPQVMAWYPVYTLLLFSSPTCTALAMFRFFLGGYFFFRRGEFKFCSERFIMHGVRFFGIWVFFVYLHLAFVLIGVEVNAGCLSNYISKICKVRHGI